MADLHAFGADEIDALDGLVDALAIEDAAAKFLDANAEEVLVLALDFPPAGFVLGEIGLFLVLVNGVGEPRVEILLRVLGLALSRLQTRSAVIGPDRRSRRPSRRPRRSPCGRSPRRASPCRPHRRSDRPALARSDPRLFPPSWLFSLPCRNRLSLECRGQAR